MTELDQKVRRCGIFSPWLSLKLELDNSNTVRVDFRWFHENFTSPFLLLEKSTRTIILPVNKLVSDFEILNTKPFTFMGILGWGRSHKLINSKKCCKCESDRVVKPRDRWKRVEKRRITLSFTTEVSPRIVGNRPNYVV